MAEVMKFEDFKNEGTEAACKVMIKIAYLCLKLKVLFITILQNAFRLQENTDNKDEIMSLKMEILYFSNLMPELV